jgi:hypothetical protein
MLEDTAKWGASSLVFVALCYYNEQMKENDMGRACGTYSSEYKGIQSLCNASRKGITWKT